MTEQEIIKHTRKAFTIFKSSNLGITHKLIDILTEIVIIVFAVSVSIGFHNWSERRHDNKEEREFLLGFRKDLQIEITNMTNSKEFYSETLLGIKYFLNVEKGITLNRDSASKYSSIFFGTTSLDPHIGRYEGLKSSGKFRIIENKELLNNMIDLHETIIQRIQLLNEKYDQQTAKLASLVEQNLQYSTDGIITNAEEVIRRNDMRILLNLSRGLITENVIGIHEEGIKKCKEIITQIDEESR